MTPEHKQKRASIEKFFRDTAIKESQKTQVKELSDFLDNTSNKRYLFVIKESIGDIFICTSLFKSIKEQYPNFDIYVACEPVYFEIFDGNPHIHRVIPYTPVMESEIQMTGAGGFKGYFDVYCNVALSTQKQLNYLTNNKIALQLNS